MNTKYTSSIVLKTSEFSRVRSTGENFDVFNSRYDIYLAFTEKSKFSFSFILCRKFTVNQLTMLHAESQWYKRRQRCICDRIPGSIYSHGDLQIKIKFIQRQSARQVTSCKRHKCLMTLRNIAQLHCLIHWSWGVGGGGGGAWGWKSKIEKKQQQIWIILVPENVPHILTKKMPTLDVFDHK